MSTIIRSFRCRNEKCDVNSKHFHVSYFSESNGVIVSLESSEPSTLETFYSLKECREYCKGVPGVTWEDTTKEK